MEPVQAMPSVRLLRLPAGRHSLLSLVAAAEIGTARLCHRPPSEAVAVGLELAQMELTSMAARPVVAVLQSRKLALIS
jgi:hypothetical protein